MLGRYDSGIRNAGGAEIVQYGLSSQASLRRERVGRQRRRAQSGRPRGTGEARNAHHGRRRREQRRDVRRTRRSRRRKCREDEPGQGGVLQRAHTGAARAVHRRRSARHADIHGGRRSGARCKRGRSQQRLYGRLPKVPSASSTCARSRTSWTPPSCSCSASCARPGSSSSTPKRTSSERRGSDLPVQISTTTTRAKSPRSRKISSRSTSPSPTKVTTRGSRCRRRTPSASSISRTSARRTSATSFRSDLKDHSLPGNELDAGDRDGASNAPRANIASWPVKGMYRAGRHRQLFDQGQDLLRDRERRRRSQRLHSGRGNGPGRLRSAVPLDPVAFPNAATSGPTRPSAG